MSHPNAVVVVTATVHFKVWLRNEEDITEYETLEEAGQVAIADELAAMPEVQADVLSWDDSEVAEYGPFCDPVECPDCETPFALAKEVTHIRQFGHCHHCWEAIQ